MHFTTLHFDTLESTNTEAAERAQQGAKEGLCIVADEQTAGRGRQGREWISQTGAGVFMSLVLRPKLAPGHLTLIPLMASVAVYDVLLKGFLIEPDIKWPNDILVNERKICGILSEAVETPNGLAVILGIGINLKGDDLPDNATGIEQESTIPAVRDDIVDVVTGEIARLYDILHATPAKIIEEWKTRSTYIEGKSVEVRSGGETFRGVTCGIEENGALRVKTADGVIRVVQAGDVERVRGGD
jgi:BirA family transcriptional regulator, biotin operon repressor / biotin---[acetyl-CoA-carboxylase] ligase